jgi:MFS family permease
VNNQDPRITIDEAPMGALQIAAVAITVGLNALDGFDVLSISFAAPGIATEWGIDRAALGVVLSMELIGMAVGSMLLGGVADRIGRRRTILAVWWRWRLGCSWSPPRTTSSLYRSGG